MPLARHQEVNLTEEKQIGYFEYLPRHPGHGDRSGRVLAPVITALNSIVLRI
jgi:hypothetical protein